MEKNYKQYKQEIKFLSDQLDASELMVLGYLKGFDRRTNEGMAKKRSL